MEPLTERCAIIEMLVLDVDGVLTDGSITYGDDGTELKTFFVRDGSALRVWHDSGRRSAIISGRESRTVEVRAAELGVTAVYQGVADKLTAYRRLLAASGVLPGRVACVGDDLPDLPLIRNCGLGVAVADACPELREDAHYVTRAPGGRGAVRETVELILRSSGQWQSAVDRLRGRQLEV